MSKCNPNLKSKKQHVDNIKAQIKADVEQAINGKQWPFSSNGPFKEKASIPNVGVDQSFEEIRYMCYEAAKNNTFEQFHQQFNAEATNAVNKFKSLLEFPPEVMDLVTDMYDAIEDDDTTNNVIMQKGLKPLTTSTPGTGAAVASNLGRIGAPATSVTNTGGSIYGSSGTNYFASNTTQLQQVPVFEQQAGIFAQQTPKSFAGNIAEGVSAQPKFLFPDPQKSVRDTTTSGIMAEPQTQQQQLFSDANAKQPANLFMQKPLPQQQQYQLQHQQQQQLYQLPQHQAMQSMFSPTQKLPHQTYSQVFLPPTMQNTLQQQQHQVQNNMFGQTQQLPQQHQSRDLFTQGIQRFMQKSDQNPLTGNFQQPQQQQHQQQSLFRQTQDMPQQPQAPEPMQVTASEIFQETEQLPPTANGKLTPAPFQAKFFDSLDPPPLEVCFDTHKF